MKKIETWIASQSYLQTGLRDWRSEICMLRDPVEEELTSSQFLMYHKGCPKKVPKTGWERLLSRQ